MRLRVERTNSRQLFGVLFFSDIGSSIADALGGRVAARSPFSSVMLWMLRLLRSVPLGQTPGTQRRVSE
jgi:hypothetical protein